MGLPANLGPDQLATASSYGRNGKRLGPAAAREQLGRTRVQLAQEGRPGHAIIRAAPIQGHQHGVWLQLQHSTRMGRQRIGANPRLQGELVWARSVV